MRRILAVATVAALTLASGVALADQATGKIENINLQTNRFKVGDKLFQWSSQNSKGVSLKDLKDGDSVKVMYQPNQGGALNPVSSIQKME
jgi:cytochrome oxidase Cu insertion factor (SCO1/SenC/PrrC family)